MRSNHGRLSPAPWPASGQLYIYKPAGYTLAPASCWACLNLRQFFLDLSLTYILYKPILFTCQAACCLLLVACCLPLVACGLCRNWSHAKRRAQPSNTNSPGAWACCHLTPKLTTKNGPAERIRKFLILRFY